MRQARFVLICFCHSVFLGISSPGLINDKKYLKKNKIIIHSTIETYNVQTIFVEGGGLILYCRKKMVHHFDKWEGVPHWIW